MNRKTRRKLENQMGKDASENLAEKIFQFNKLPESCSACDKGFDKRNKDMVQSWNVVVRQEVVRIFCPQCIKKTQEVLNERKKTKPRSSHKNT